jgi:hypothetical protein
MTSLLSRRATFLRMRRLAAFAVSCLIAGRMLGAVPERTRTQAADGLKVGAGGHYFVDAVTGEPVFLLADTAWNLGALTLEEIERYFENRERHGFNAVMFALTFAPQASEANAYGEAAYQGPDHTQLNPAYFATGDRIVRMAAAHGLYVMIYAMWAGEKAGTMNRYSAEQLTMLGTALGRHYAGISNVIWCAGGEASPHYIEPARVNAIGQALKAGSGGRNLVTVHPVSGNSDSRFYADSPWIDFYLSQAKSGNGPVNAAYDAAALVLGDWSLAHARPSMMGEHRYESGTHEDPLIQRRSLYQCVFAGGCGYAYGHDALWQMTPHTRQAWMLKGWNPGVADWTEALDTPAVAQLQLIKGLLYAHPFLSRIPDQGLVLEGQGSEVRSRVQATRDGTPGNSDASYMMAYLSQPAAITLDTSVIGSATLRVSWFDPATGKTTLQAARWTNSGRLQLEADPSRRDAVVVIEAAE